MLKIRANWLVALALTAFLSIGLLSGCQENTSTAPTTIQQNQDPSSIDLSHAIDVQNRHTDEMMSIAGVNGTGVGLEGSTPVVYVFTQTETATGIPAKLEDVKTHIEYIGEVKAFAGKPASGYKGTYRAPMFSGVSTGNNNECAAGTIACVVKSNNSDNYYLLSNNHVFARINVGQTGEVIDQPGRYDNNCVAANPVGTLANFIPITMGTTTSVNNTVDCALSTIAPGINASSTTVSGYTPSVNITSATINMGVKKSGRTTGLTTGSVSSINVTVNVNYGVGTARFVGQVYVGGKFSDAGDSGSLIVTNNANNTPVALLFAGSANSTIGNPIINVLQQLNVSIVSGHLQPAL